MHLLRFLTLLQLQKRLLPLPLRLHLSWHLLLLSSLLLPLPLMVVSGSAVAADMDPMLRLGKVAFLRKPYTGDRLVAAARSLK